MLIPEKINLLYIEDDPGSASVTMDYLRRATISEFNVVHMCTLKEGLEYLQTECNEDHCDINVILLDLILPNSQGINTYKSVVDICPFIPVVIISGHEDMAYECVRLGAQDYLFKPDYNGGTLTRSLMYAIERDRLEVLRLEAESKYKDVVNSTPVGFHSYELRNGKLIFVSYNPAANKILKVDNEKFMGKCIRSAFPNLANTEIPDRYLEVAKTGVPWSGGIIEYKDKNIKKGYFRVNAFKTGPRCLTASFEDVTQQVTIENRYRDLVEFTKAAILKLDFSTNKFVYANDVACKQFGYTREELLESNLSKLLTEKSNNDWIKRREALKRGEFIDNSFEYEVIRKDGNIIWGLITSEYLENKDGVVDAANIVAIDITDRKLAEKEAKEKEEFIFNELETRIQVWRTELDQGTKHKNQIQPIDMSISKFSSDVVEVT